MRRFMLALLYAAVVFSVAQLIAMAWLHMWPQLLSPLVNWAICTAGLVCVHGSKD